jgi:hypothetical protein
MGAPLSEVREENRVVLVKVTEEGEYVGSKEVFRGR